MKLVLSFNYRNFQVEYDELVNIIKTCDSDNNIKGFELHFGPDVNQNNFEKFIDFICENNYYLRLHAPTLDSIDEYKEFFKYVDSLYDRYKKNINVVFHPIYDEDREKSIKITCDYLDEIFKVIDNNKITLSIENLNDRFGIKRLKKKDLETILEKFDNLKFTYDIGHELIDGRIESNLNKLLEDRINNIHIHVYNKDKDHYPIVDFEDEDSKKVINAVKELIYNDIYVTEYAMIFIDKETNEDKTKEYIRCSIEIDKLLNR